MYRAVQLGGGLLLAAGLSIGSSACVDPFSGSNIQSTFSGSVQIPGTSGEQGRPPPRTHYSYYGLSFQRDADDTVIGSSAFKIIDFEIAPVVDQASPCFMEDGGSRFEGLHTTMYLEKLTELYVERYGLSGPEDFNPFETSGEFTDGDKIDYVTAQVRMDNLTTLQSQVRAVVPHSPAEYPATDASCSCGGFDTSQSDEALAASTIPAPECIADACSDKRAAICRAFWKLHPSHYEGSDEIFTLPHSAKLLGMVDGVDPRNNQFIGGVGMWVPAALDNIDGMTMHWQYDCAPDTPPEELFDCQPVYPSGFDPAAMSSIGYHYMAGEVVHKTRGVINVPMQHRLFPQVRGEAAIWSKLDEDTVQF